MSTVIDAIRRCVNSATANDVALVKDWLAYWDAGVVERGRMVDHYRQEIERRRGRDDNFETTIVAFLEEVILDAELEREAEASS